MKIALLEQENKTIKKAVASCPGILFLNASDMPSACEMLSGGKVDAVVAGIDITTRDMVRACKENLEKTHKYFSSCFVMEKAGQTIVVADAGVCKNPNVEMMKEIVLETYETAKAVLNDEPRIAMLSF